MKTILSTFLLFLATFFCTAQKELWGVNSGLDTQPGYYAGNITKYDIYGENPQIIHEFDGANGKIPLGRLFQASNGKLYGTTSRGGIVGLSGTPSGDGAGVLFEYDLILDKYRVLKFFDFNAPYATNPEVGLIEPIVGQLYGASFFKIFKYDIASETTISYNSVSYKINSELHKGSDGNLYTNVSYLYCPNTNHPYPDSGSIVKFNMSTNNLSIIHPLNCDLVSEGSTPYGQLIETNPQNFVGTTLAGGFYLNTANFIGTLFNYDSITNSFTKKIDFNQLTIGGFPTSLIRSTNGKLYGLCQVGGAPQSCNPTYNYGTLYEYTPATNVIEVKQYFNSCSNSVQYPTTLMQTSLGHFVGTMPTSGLFRWDAATNTISMPNYTSSNPNLYNTANLIEICRKPSYREFLPNTYTKDLGDAFSFDVFNTNATTYVWKKGTTIVPLQTTGVLNIASFSASDSGVYTCEMTNECGTTTTMPLYLNLNLGIDAIDFFKDKITLYPNPTKNNLQIKIPERNDLTISKISISNLLGQVVYSDEISRSFGTTKIVLDVSKFETGVYNVTMRTDKGDWNGKFVRE